MHDYMAKTGNTTRAAQAKKRDSFKRTVLKVVVIVTVLLGAAALTN